jgi:hypothetical protein
MAAMVVVRALAAFSGERGGAGSPPLGEYLVNIVEGRRTAQERVTGGRWRRIELGDVLAELRPNTYSN